MESKQIIINGQHIATVYKYSKRDYGWSIQGVDPVPHIRGCFPTEDEAEKEAVKYIGEYFEKLKMAFTNSHAIGWE